MVASYPTLQHRWFEEVWNKGNADAIDELLDPNVIGHGLTDAEGNEIRGIDAFKAFYTGFRAAFPDIRIDIIESVTEGDKQAVLCRVTGTHSGEGFMIAPTQKCIEFSGICMARFKDGRIIESWNCFDFMKLMQQLGVLN